MTSPPVYSAPAALLAPAAPSRTRTFWNAAEFPSANRPTYRSNDLPPTSNPDRPSVAGESCRERLDSYTPNVFMVDTESVICYCPTR